VIRPRPLDRYVVGEFSRIFVTTMLGFPILNAIFDLTQNVGKYLARGIPRGDLALSYLYYLPESMFLVLPAAVLFATVFSISGFTRHAEVTAAKASGISFYRLIAPIILAAAVASGLDLGLGELVPGADARRNALLQIDKAQIGTVRYNFTFAGEYGRVYNVGTLQTESGTIGSLQIERKGKGADYPTYMLMAATARYDSTRYGSTRSAGPLLAPWLAAPHWELTAGELDVLTDSGPNLAMTFASGIDRHLTEAPVDLMAKPRPPQEMRYAELQRSISALERSGSDANLSKVELALKIAVPCTCLIIALFGAPLATSSQRGGSVYGIAVSLATTVIFLLLIQLTRAIGGKGIIPPTLAAWLPGMLFGVLSLILLARVRT
jgi:lipopolysaccharide export system permease protein